jgi:hypothetical protein
MTLQLLHYELPYTVYEENLIFFFISVGGGVNQPAPTHRRLLDRYLKMTGGVFPPPPIIALWYPIIVVFFEVNNGPDYNNLV